MSDTIPPAPAPVALRAPREVQRFWLRTYEKLRSYRREHGNVLIPSGEPLLDWMKTQRRLRRAGRLSSARIALLEELGFHWNVADCLVARRQARRAGHLAELQRFWEQRGRGMVSLRDGASPALAGWMEAQRWLRRKGRLSAEQVAQLDAVGFVWDMNRWYLRLMELRDYKAAHGTCLIPVSDTGARSLAQWVRIQQNRRLCGSLDPDQAAALAEIGLPWPIKGPSRRDRLEQLEAYRAQHGDCRVPQIYAPDPGFGRWVGVQRLARKDGRLSPEQVAQLDALGFSWHGHGVVTLGADGRAFPAMTKRWEKRYEQLSEYHRSHGDCRVPIVYAAAPGLSLWIYAQRSRRHKGRLAPGQVARLDALGFPWALSSLSRDKRLQQLKDYQAKHGNCRVPRVYAAAPGLGNWIYAQRYRRCKGKLTPEQVAQLDALGFIWVSPRFSRDILVQDTSRVSKWSNRLQQLKDYLAKHGNVRVPKVYPAAPGLNAWTYAQRYRRQEGRLAPEQVAQLDALGFIWASSRISRDQRLQQLKDYLAKHGDCRVPVHYKDDPGLGQWASLERCLCNKGLRPADWVAKLDALGFVWHLQAVSLAKA